MKVKKEDVVFGGWLAIGVIISLLFVCSEVGWDQAEIIDYIKALMSIDILLACWITGVYFSASVHRDQREKEGLRRFWNSKAFDELEERVRKLEEKE